MRACSPVASVDVASSIAHRLGFMRARLQAAGFSPTNRRNSLVKWGWSATPHSRAISLSALSVESMSPCARSIRRRMMYSCGELPILLRKVTLKCNVLRERERANLMKALQREDGRIYGKDGAAELLGINPTTLASRLRAFKITPARPR